MTITPESTYGLIELHDFTFANQIFTTFRSALDSYANMAELKALGDFFRSTLDLSTMAELKALGDFQIRLPQIRVLIRNGYVNRIPLLEVVTRSDLPETTMRRMGLLLLASGAKPFYRIRDERTP